MLTPKSSTRQRHRYSATVWKQLFQSGGESAVSMAICRVKMIRERRRSSGIPLDFCHVETVMKREKRSAGSWIRKNAEVEKRVWSSSSRKRGNLMAAAAAAAATILNKTARFSSWHLRCVRFNTASSTFPRLSFVFSLFIPFFFLFSFQFVSRFLSSFSFFLFFFFFSSSLVFVESHSRRWLRWI